MSQSILPKVILHEHVEGSITPEVAKKLAQKNNIDFPVSLCYSQGEYDEKEYPHGRYNYDETQFTEFVKTYDTVASFIKEPEDYYLITKDFLLRNAQQGLIYCELLISPYHMSIIECDEEQAWSAKRFINVLTEMDKAIDDVRKIYDITVRYHVIGIRHLGADTVYQTLSFIQKNNHKYIVGFNIAGNEKAGHFDHFSNAHQLATQLGLKKSYHAGEIEPAQSIVNALNHGATRIGHGIRAIEDNNVIQQLIEQNITLEIAITSNRILVNELHGDVNNHPVRKLYDLGVRITLNTDDAGIFGTDIDKEYHIAQTIFHFSRLELLDISLCGIDAAFIEEKDKKRLSKKILNTFTPHDITQLTKAISDNRYHTAIIERFKSYQQRLLF